MTQCWTVLKLNIVNMFGCLTGEWNHSSFFYVEHTVQKKIGQVFRFYVKNTNQTLGVLYASSCMLNFYIIFLHFLCWQMMCHCIYILVASLSQPSWLFWSSIMHIEPWLLHLTIFLYRTCISSMRNHALVYNVVVLSYRGAVLLHIFHTIDCLFCLVECYESCSTLQF